MAIETERGLFIPHATLVQEVAKSSIFFWRPIWNECRGVGIKVLGVYHTWLKKSKADDWLPQFPCLVLGSRGVFFFVVLFSMGLWVPGIMRPPWRHTIYSWKMISTLHQIGSPISQVQRERIQSSWHIMFMNVHDMFSFLTSYIGNTTFWNKDSVLNIFCSTKVTHLMSDSVMSQGSLPRNTY